MKKILIPVICLLLAACGTSHALMPVPYDIEYGKVLYPGITIEDLNAGRDIFIANCSACHPLKNPLKRTTEEWNNIVPKMVSNVNRKADSVAINAEQQQLLLQYLVTLTNSRGK